MDYEQLLSELTEQETILLAELIEKEATLSELISVISEEETMNLFTMFENETGKEASSYEEVFSQLTEEDIDIIQERIAGLGERLIQSGQDGGGSQVRGAGYGAAMGAAAGIAAGAQLALTQKQGGVGAEASRRLKKVIPSLRGKSKGKVGAVMAAGAIGAGLIGGLGVGAPIGAAFGSVRGLLANKKQHAANMQSKQKKEKKAKPLMAKEAGQQNAAALGALVPILSGLGAEKGKGWATTIGAMLGGVGGHLAGNTLAYAAASPRAQKPIRMLLGMAGGAGGAALGHGKDKKKENAEEKEKKAEALVPFVTEAEFSYLVDIFENENQKSAENFTDVFSMLSEEDANVIGDRIYQYMEEEETHSEKIAEQLNPLADSLTEEIYAEMQKDAGFKDTLVAGSQKALSHVGRNAGVYGLGALAGSGFWNQHRLNKKSRKVQENLAQMIAAETTADIATDQVFDKRDRFIIGRQQRTMGQVQENRAAVITLANLLKKQGVTPEKVKNASMEKEAFGGLAAKAMKGLGKAKKAVTSAGQGSVKTWKEATQKGTVTGYAKASRTLARKRIAKGAGFMAGGAAVKTAVS